MLRYAFVLAAALGVGVQPASAKTIVVEMRNSVAGRAMVFQPSLVRAQPGDTVTFKAVDLGHDAASIATLQPSATAPFKGQMSKDVTIRFERGGLYGVKCNPHFGMGMVALIAVGKPSSSELAKARAAAALLPGLAKRNMSSLIDQAATE